MSNETVPTAPPMPAAEPDQAASTVAPAEAQAKAADKPARQKRGPKKGSKVSVMINPDLPVQNPIHCETQDKYLFPDTETVMEYDDWVEGQVKGKGVILT